MTNFVFATDSHLANRPPTNRIDDYNEAILNKWLEVFKYAYTVGAHVICGGDLFHTHRTNDELTAKFVDKWLEYACDGRKFYYLLGNHDIQAGNVDFIDKTNMGLLTRYDWFELLDQEKPIVVNNVLLTGINYSAKMECESFFDFNGGRRKCIRGDQDEFLKILVTHAMITNKGIIVKGKHRAVDVKDVETNADIMLNGHFHDGHKKVVKGKCLEREFAIINPGSIARMNLKEAKDGYGPRLAHIMVRPDNTYEVGFKDIKCAPLDEVFDVEKDKGKKRDIKEKDRFVKTLKKMRQSKIMGDNFREELKKVLDNPPKKLRKTVNKSVIKILKEKLDVVES